MQKVIQTLQLRIFGSEGDGSTFSQEVSPASRFLSPASAEVRRTAVTSGLTCSVPFTRSGPIGLLVRTLVASSRWYSPVRRLTWDISPLFSERLSLYTASGRSTSWRPSREILSVKDIPSNRYLFRLVPSERRTEGIEFGLLPTVQTQGLKRCNSQGKTEFMPLELLPTPMATDIHHAERVAELKKRGAKGLRCRDKGEAGANGLTDWMDFHGLLPTPTASDKNTGTTKERKDGASRMSDLKHNIAHQYGRNSQLNPRFVAEMMGFPVDWTVLPFLNGGKNP